MRSRIDPLPPPPERESTSHEGQRRAYDNLQPPPAPQRVRVEVKQKKSLLGRVVRGVLYTAGAIIALRIAAPYIEKYFAGVTFERIRKAFTAARPGGNLGTGPAPTMRPSPGTGSPHLDT